LIYELLTLMDWSWQSSVAYTCVGRAARENGWQQVLLRVHTN